MCFESSEFIRWTVNLKSQHMKKGKPFQQLNNPCETGGEDLLEARHVFVVHPSGRGVTFVWMLSAMRQRAHNQIQSDSFNQHARGKREEEITSYHSTDMKHIFFTLLIIGGPVAGMGGERFWPLDVSTK